MASVDLITSTKDQIQTINTKTNPIKIIIRTADTMYAIINVTALCVWPLYNCPKPGNKKLKMAANKTLFSPLGATPATLTPQCGHISALMLIFSPQL